MKLTLDVENTVTKRDGKMYLDPFEPDNKLVMVGCLTDKGEEYLYRDNFDGVQEHLDNATILIGHNIAYDLMWLCSSPLPACSICTNSVCPKQNMVALPSTCCVHGLDPSVWLPSSAGPFGHASRNVTGPQRDGPMCQWAVPMPRPK